MEITAGNVQYVDVLLCSTLDITPILLLTEIPCVCTVRKESTYKDYSLCNILYKALCYFHLSPKYFFYNIMSVQEILPLRGQKCH